MAKLVQNTNRLEDLTMGFGVCDEASGFMGHSLGGARGERESSEERLRNIGAD
jgi:hypothetical protein